MKSTLTFTLSTGRDVEITLRATDGGRLKVAEVFEVIGHASQGAGDFNREVERAGAEAALARSVRGLLRVARSPAKAVPTARLVARLRLLHPTISGRRMERLLPRVMAVHFNCAVSHDLPGSKGRVRGYRGVTFRSEVRV